MYYNEIDNSDTLMEKFRLSENHMQAKADKLTYNTDKIQRGKDRMRGTGGTGRWRHRWEPPDNHRGAKARRENLEEET